MHTREDYDLSIDNGITVYYTFRDTCEYSFAGSIRSSHLLLNALGQVVDGLGVLFDTPLYNVTINPKHPQDLEGFTFEGKAIKILNGRYLIWNYKENQWEMYG